MESSGKKAALFAYEGHEDLTYPEGHPFRPERAAMLMQLLDRDGILSADWLDRIAASPASRDALLTFHEAAYLDMLERVGRGEVDLGMVGFGLGGDDCPAFPGVYELASLAAGASLTGARMLAEGRCQIAFNPIGGFHHAGPAHAEGFCYLNDVVLACRELADRRLRVACLDLDVHHGNGTEDAFISDPRVLTISTHETGKEIYPWRGFEDTLGEGDGRGYNVNIPLLPGTDDDAFEVAFEGIVLPLVEAFAPDVILLEIGMDVLRGDPLAHFMMTNNGIADAVYRLRKLETPTLVVGGGGYNPRNTAKGWALAFSVLCDAEPFDDYTGMVGGVFLGDGEREGSLRDMKVFVSGEERARVDAEVERLVAYHREHTFPLHGIG